MRVRETLRVTAFVAGFFSVLVVPGPVALGDRGAIVAVGKVDIEEPAQRAIIAHNGSREILILQTDVKADKETKVVEFMPLPSKPKVSLAPKGCFAALKEIVKTHNLRYVIKYRDARKGTVEKTDAVKVVVSAQLGPHAVTVVEVKDADMFVKWVRKFFRDNKLGEPALGEDLRGIVADYLKRGLRFFAFDIVTLSPQTKTVQPLTYEFKTDHLYYPLKVTNLYGGTGTIELFLLRPSGQKILKRLYIKPRPGPTVRQVGFGKRVALQPGEWRFIESAGAALKPSEIARLHPALPSLMGGEKARLCAVKYEGPLNFEGDVWAPVGYYTPEGAALGLFKALRTGDAAAIEALVAVPFAFDREKVITDKKELMKRFADIIKQHHQKQYRITPSTAVFRFDKGSGWRGTWRQTGNADARDGRLPSPSKFDIKFVEQYLKTSAQIIEFKIGITGKDDEYGWLIFKRIPNTDRGYKIFGCSG